MPALPQSTTESNWRARLELEFQYIDRRSVLRRCHHYGPLRVQRAFYPELDSSCHVYILHPPGGVVGGDRLELDCQLDSHSRTLLTTPSAGKFYRSNGCCAEQINAFSVQPGAALEWLPQENIIYSGARLNTKTRIELHGDAHAIGWEIFCLGRPAAGELFERGSCRQNLEIYRDGRALLVERGDWQGGSDLLNVPWGLHGQPANGTLFATLQDRALVDTLREHIQAAPPARFAVTQLQDLLICRYLGPSSMDARALFARAWTLLRPAVLHKPACLPRVWAV